MPHVRVVAEAFISIHHSNSEQNKDFLRWNLHLEHLRFPAPPEAEPFCLQTLRTSSQIHRDHRSDQSQGWYPAVSGALQCLRWHNLFRSLLETWVQFHSPGRSHWKCLVRARGLWEVFVERPFFQRSTSDPQLVARRPVGEVRSEGWEGYATFSVGDGVTRRRLLQWMKKKVRSKRS